MAKHLSIGSIIEKNKISSEDFFITLIEAHIKDEEGNDVTTLRFAQNTEAVVFGVDENGDPASFAPANFEIDISVENNSEPSIKLSAQDQSRALSQYIEAYGGLTNSTVKMIVVNTGYLDAPAEMEETFKVMSASVNKYLVELDLGTESVVAKRFPEYRQFKDRCPWRYKGNRCGYSGDLPKCDFTAFGPNGCLAHDNLHNFGGFPGLNGQD